jgi:Holliday junction resolvasome RuvABC ATP-dependent DNA helicase subunit
MEKQIKKKKGIKVIIIIFRNSLLGKILLMGKSAAGKTTMKSIIFAR